MSNYNPFIAALKALTSDQAIAFYSVRAQADTQMVVDTALTVGIGIYQLCSLVYSLGAIAGEAHYSAVCTHTKAAEPTQYCLPKPKAIAALPPASSPKPSPLTLIWVNPIAALPPAPSPKPPIKTVSPGLTTLTKQGLISLCIARGLKPKKTMKKAELLALLTN